MDGGRFNLCVFDGVRNPDEDPDCKPVLRDINTFTGMPEKILKTITTTSMNFRVRDIDDMTGHVFHSLDS